MASIPESYLPPRELWPDKVYTLPEYRDYPAELNVTEEVLDRNLALGRGDRVAIYYDNQRTTYNELVEQVNRLGNALRDLGVESPDRVMIRCPNIPQAVVANFAILKIGGVSVPTSPLLATKEVVHVANDSESKVIFVFAPLLDMVEAALGELTTVKHVVVIGGNPQDIKNKGFIPWGELLSQGGTKLEPVRRGRLEVALLLYTSGTTGMPKGTVHFVEDPLLVADGFGKYCWRVTEDDVIGGPAPLAFAAGYATAGIIPFRFGGAASLIARFTPEQMFDNIQNHGITITSILPTAYRKMLQLPDAEKTYDLSSVKICTGGGEALGADTYYAWKEKFNLEIYEGLGTTEMMFVFITNAVSLKAKAGSVGEVVPGYEARVVNEEGAECAPGELGRLQAKGPTGTLYWRPSEDNNRLLEEQKKAVKGGWCQVGDVVYRDEDGYFWFVSRESDLIKTSGYRLGPQEIEESLVQHEAIADCGVIGVPDPVRGEIVKAYVALNEGYSWSDDLQEAILDFLKERVAVYKLPRAFQVVPDIPRTPTGKILRRILRDRDTAEREASA